MRIAAQVVVQAASGVAAGIGFGVLLLLLDIGGLGTLLASARDGASYAIFLLGAALAFAPAVICTTVGLLASGNADAGSLPPARARRNVRGTAVPLRVRAAVGRSHRRGG